MKRMLYCNFEFQSRSPWIKVFRAFELTEFIGICDRTLTYNLLHKNILTIS